MKFDLHPLCALFPRMTGAAYEALKADILANGLRQPIVTHQGMILDGGNRYAACMDLGVKPIMTEYTGSNLVTYVLSANFYRRHLSAGQQAAIVASAQDWAKAQTVGGSGANQYKSNPATLPDSTRDTVASRAAQSGASDRTQRMADAVAKKAPDLAVKVAHGEISLPKAAKQIAPKKEAAVPDPMPEEFGPDAAELEAQARAEIADQQWLQKLLDSDDQLATAHAEIKRLNAVVAALEVARDGYMNGRNEAIKMVKKLQAKLEKLERVA